MTLPNTTSASADDTTPEPVAGADTGSGPAEAPPPQPAGRSTAARFAWLALAIVSLVFSLVQFVGGLEEVGDLFGPGKVSGEQIASRVSGAGGSGLWICGDLRAEVGATTTCATPSKPTAGIRATVTAVDGDVVSYDLEMT